MHLCTHYDEVWVKYILWCEVWCIGQSAVRWVCLGEKDSPAVVVLLLGLSTDYLTVVLSGFS